MITVEYVLALAGTLALAIAVGDVVQPALSNYRAALEAETAEAQQLILDLQAACPAPVSP
ncbi:hypothetical protein [Roseovarius sp. MBR-6]|jgi:hypothetical protein|uniref:hypothetical protein n=1 Tax=Roseovarius sp. MBR-6 TaxID=3156459 RepID=UPI00339B7E7C